MFVGQLQISQCRFVLFFSSVEIGAQDKQLSVIRVDLKTFFDLQLAFLKLPVDQVVFGFLVELLDLGGDRLKEDLNLRVPLLQTIGIPELSVGLGWFQHTPVEHGSKDHQIYISLIDHDAILNLTQSQLSLIHLKVGHRTLEVIAEQGLFRYFFHYFFVELRVPLRKGSEVSVLQNVLGTAYF